MQAVDARFDLAERPHGDFDFARRHADAGVDDTQADESVGVEAGVNGDSAFLRGELHAIRQYVDEDLLGAQRIGEDWWQLRRTEVGDLDVFLLGFRKMM